LHQWVVVRRVHTAVVVIVVDAVLYVQVGKAIGLSGEVGGCLKSVVMGIHVCLWGVETVGVIYQGLGIVDHLRVLNFFIELFYLGGFVIIYAMIPIIWPFSFKLLLLSCLLRRQNLLKLIIFYLSKSISEIPCTIFNGINVEFNGFVITIFHLVLNRLAIPIKFN
jgi:hypothetical protein